MNPLAKPSTVPLLALVCLAVSLTASPFELVSRRDPSLAPPAAAGGDSFGPMLTPDGRFVLFASTADNLVVDAKGNSPGSSPTPRLNVFLRDRVLGSTVLVSVSLDGLTGGNSRSIPLGISDDGRYALVESTASNLVPGDTNNAADVFLRDLANHQTVLVSAAVDGGCGNGASSHSVLTPDGRYVAFSSTASNLVLAGVYKLAKQEGEREPVNTGWNSGFESMS